MQNCRASRPWNLNLKTRDIFRPCVLSDSRASCEFCPKPRCVVVCCRFTLLFHFYIRNILENDLPNDHRPDRKCCTSYFGWFVFFLLESAKSCNSRGACLRMNHSAVWPPSEFLFRTYTDRVTFKRLNASDDCKQYDGIRPVACVQERRTNWDPNPTGALMFDRRKNS